VRYPAARHSTYAKCSPCRATHASPRRHTDPRRPVKAGPGRARRATCSSPHPCISRPGGAPVVETAEPDTLLEMNAGARIPAPQIFRSGGRPARALALAMRGNRARIDPRASRFPANERAEADVLCQALAVVTPAVWSSRVCVRSFRTGVWVTAAAAIRWVAAMSTRSSGGAGMVTVMCCCRPRCRAGSYGAWSCQQRQMMRLHARPRVRSARG
jgi:hypothetical protein